MNLDLETPPHSRQAAESLKSCAVASNPGSAVSVFLFLGAMSGFASLTWLVLQYRQSIRRRLTISTARALTGGLDVLVQYRPGRARVGLRARVQLIEPKGASLMAGIRQERGDRYGAYVVAEPEAAIHGRELAVPLRHLRPDPAGIVCGVFYVTGSDNVAPTSARIRLEIWTDAGPTRLALRETTLKVINW